MAYASRKMSPAELNYCVTRQELVALFFFLKYFRHHLLGRKFLVRTDHAALRWLKKLRDPVGQLARWIGYIEEYTFDLQHRPGVRRGNADALSRRPCRNKECRCKDLMNFSSDDEMFSQASSLCCRASNVEMNNGPGEEVESSSKQECCAVPVLDYLTSEVNDLVCLPEGSQTT